MRTSERVAIVGSRTYPDLAAVADYVATLPYGTVVISGGARGVDGVAEQAASRKGLECHVYYPNWAAHGRRAAAIRNREIVDACDRVVAFWDGRSPGTRMTIDMAKSAGKPVEVIR